MQEHMLVAFEAFHQDLRSLQFSLNDPLLSNTQKDRLGASKHFKLWEWVLRTLVQPPVHLLQAGRGRSESGKLSEEEAWPLFLGALKTGLRALLLSGRHPLYV